MTYNLHPLVVHFPIAFLFLYSVIKILPLQTWFPLVAWKHIERTLLFFGVLGAFVADSTGEIAEELFRPDHQLVEIHETFASVTVVLYSMLLVGEIVSVFRLRYEHKLTKTIHTIAVCIEKLLCHPILSRIIAALGFIAISTTGLLGGVMVYGVTADPFAEIVLKLLGIEM